MLEWSEDEDEAEERCWEDSLNQAVRCVVADLILQLQHSHFHSISQQADVDDAAEVEEAKVSVSAGEKESVRVVRGGLLAADEKDDASSAVQEGIGCGLREDSTALHCVPVLSVHLSSAGHEKGGSDCASAGAATRKELPDVRAKSDGNTQAGEAWFSPLPPLPPPQGSLHSRREPSRPAWLWVASEEQEASQIWGNDFHRSVHRVLSSRCPCASLPPSASHGEREAHRQRLSTPAPHTRRFTSPRSQCSLGSFVHAHSWRPVKARKQIMTLKEFGHLVDSLGVRTQAQFADWCSVNAEKLFSLGVPLQPALAYKGWRGWSALNSIGRGGLGEGEGGGEEGHHEPLPDVKGEGGHDVFSKQGSGVDHLDAMWPRLSTCPPHRTPFLGIPTYLDVNKPGTWAHMKESLASLSSPSYPPWGVKGGRGGGHWARLSTPAAHRVRVYGDEDDARGRERDGFVLVGDGNRDTHRIDRAKESEREQIRARYHALSYTDRYENMEWGQLSHLPHHRRPVLERSLGVPCREVSETEEERLRRMVSPCVIQGLSDKYTRVQAELSSQVCQCQYICFGLFCSYIRSLLTGDILEVYLWICGGVRDIAVFICVCLARERRACVAALAAVCCAVIHTSYIHAVCCVVIHTCVAALVAVCCVVIHTCTHVLNSFSLCVCVCVFLSRTHAHTHTHTHTCLCAHAYTCMHI